MLTHTLLPGGGQIHCGSIFLFCITFCVANVMYIIRPGSNNRFFLSPCFIAILVADHSKITYNTLSPHVMRIPS